VAAIDELPPTFAVRPLVDAGLAEILNPDVPRSEWLLRVPPPLWSALASS